MDDKEILARISNLEKYSEIALAHIDNQNKVVEKMQETLSGVNSICFELKTMIGIYDTTISELKGHSHIESDKNDEKYMELLTKIHEQELQSIQENNTQDEKHNELLNKITDNIAKLDDKHVVLNDKLNDKLSARVVKLEQFRWIIAGIALTPTIIAGLIKVFPGILS